MKRRRPRIMNAVLLLLLLVTNWWQKCDAKEEDEDEDEEGDERMSSDFLTNWLTVTVWQKWVISLWCTWREREEEEDGKKCHLISVSDIRRGQRRINTISKAVCVVVWMKPTISGEIMRKLCKKTVLSPNTLKVTKYLCLKESVTDWVQKAVFLPPQLAVMLEGKDILKSVLLIGKWVGEDNSRFRRRWFLGQKRSPGQEGIASTNSRGKPLFLLFSHSFSCSSNDWLQQQLQQTFSFLFKLYQTVCVFVCMFACVCLIELYQQQQHQQRSLFGH